MDNTRRNALSIKDLLGYSHTVRWEYGPPHEPEFTENLVNTRIYLCAAGPAPAFIPRYRQRMGVRGKDFQFKVLVRTGTGRYIDNVVQARTGDKHLFWWRNSFRTRQEAEALAKRLNAYPDFQTLLNSFRGEHYVNDE